MEISRRNLLKAVSASGLVAAGLATEGILQPISAQTKPTLDSSRPDSPHAFTQNSLAQSQSHSGEMLYRTLGRTGERVSVIGLGGYHIGQIKEE